MNLAVLAGQAGSQNAGGSIMTMVILYAVIIGIFWFFAIRPQSKQKKEHENLLSTLEVGDSILTTSGFFGVVIDIKDEIVIVEFGSNKNCRIPMKRITLLRLTNRLRIKILLRLLIPEGFEVWEVYMQRLCRCNRI